MLDESPVWLILLEWGETHAVEPRVKRINTYVWTLAHRQFIERGRKPSLNVVVCGPYQSGKSTLLGHLLNLGGAVSHSDLHKLQNETGMDKYRFIVDKTRPEREEGRTHDISHKHFECPRHMINFINTPGRPKLVKNRVAGIFQADHALLVLTPDSAEAEIQEILRLLKIVLVHTVIVAVNKLDAVQDQDRGLSAFSRVVEKWTPFLSATLAFTDRFVFVPVSAKTGDNIMVNNNESGFDWHKGPSLHTVLQNLGLLSHSPHSPLRVMIDKAYTIKGVGTVVCGTVISGTLSHGQLVKIGPINKIVHVKSLHLAIPKIPIARGYPGDYIAINVPGLDKDECAQRRFGLITGCVANKEKEEFQDKKLPYQPPSAKLYLAIVLRPATELSVFRKKEAPLHPCLSFRALGYFFGIPEKQEIGKGAQITMHCHNSQIQINILQSVGWKKGDIGSKLLRNAESYKPSDFQLIYELPNDLFLTILHLLPASEVYSNLPQVSKYFFVKTLSPILWRSILHKETTYEGRLPSLDRLEADPRRQWLFYSMRKSKYQPIRRNQMSFFEIYPFGKPLGVDTFLKCPKLGTILLRLGTEVVGAAKIVDCLYNTEETEYFHQTSLKERYFFE